ncbi:MAG: DUF222 domain-containing protein, partial [Streptosporangiaceae bacterium]
MTGERYLAGGAVGGEGAACGEGAGGEGAACGEGAGGEGAACGEGSGGEGVAGRRVVAGGFAEGEVLDEAPAGIALAAFADDAYAELTGVDDDALIGLLRGWRRVTSWAQARELAVVAELARRRPADGYPSPPPGQLPVRLDEYVAEEIAPALTLTSRAAGAHLDVALALAGRPRTAAALECGRIDLARTLIILGALAPLEAAQAAAVEAAILPLAPGLTTSQLGRRLTQLVHSVDPGATRRRREAAEKQAHVACWTGPEGTATLAGRFLPPAQVLAADRRLCAIAKAWKKLGGQGGMDLLRAHAYLALLLGLDTDVPPASLLPDAQVPGPQGPASSHDDHLAEPDGPASGPEDHPAQPGHAAAVPAGLRRAGDGVALPPLTGSVDLTVPLATLLGLADRPGEAAGFGPLHADTCRTLADALASHPATTWGVIITDPDGRAISAGGPARFRRAGKTPAARTTRASSAVHAARGAPASGTARGSPPGNGAGGWTLTLT